MVISCFLFLQDTILYSYIKLNGQHAVEQTQTGKFYLSKIWSSLVIFNTAREQAADTFSTELYFVLID